MSNRQVKLVPGGGWRGKPSGLGNPTSSPTAPFLSITYLSGIFDEMKRAVPGVRGLSFVDDIGWWADGKDDDAVTAKLSKAAAASIDWAASNGVAFDHGKTVAPTPSRSTKRRRAGLLGVWLDSQLTLKNHHATRLKEGRKAMARLRRLAGQMGLSPTNCRKVMTACIRSCGGRATRLGVPPVGRTCGLRTGSST